MASQTGDMKETLKLMNTSKEKEGNNKHDNNSGNNCIDNVFVIMRGSPTKRFVVRLTKLLCDWVFFHGIGAVWTCHS